MIEEFAYTIVPLADGWFHLEVVRGTAVLFSGRLSDEDHAKRVADRYLAALRGQKSPAAPKFNGDPRVSKPCSGRRA